MLNWAQRFNIFCFLDNQQYNIQPHKYECLLAAGVSRYVQAPQHTLQQVDNLLAQKRWLFGHLSYEAMHQHYGITALKNSSIQFPLFYFFEPQYVMYIKNNELHIEGDNAVSVYNEIQAVWGFEKVATPVTSSIAIQQKLTRQQYINTVQTLQQHIQRGDCYEINFCQEFFAEGVQLQPHQLFQNLMQLSPSPFAAFYKWQQQYLICASPERFLSKEEDKLIAQPIKGTAQRSTDKKEDEILKIALQKSAKERAENVMVVDLMRNDLSRICKEGSVQVAELCGIYSFPQVHQMISTISGRLKEGTDFSKIIEATFPMGSMTGAPKKRVMQLIDEYESSARGIFSGAVGYITPDGDFDFNVVIRSVMYHAGTGYLSYQAGSGITFYSNAVQEWDECLLKAMAIKKVLLGTTLS